MDLAAGKYVPPQLIVTLVFVALCLSACAELVPTTTRSLPYASFQPNDDEAIIVLARPAPRAEEGAVAIWERLSFVRVIDEKEVVLADLEYDQYAAVRVASGAHDFFAFNWSTGGGPRVCTAAMKAELSPSKVYIARIDEQEYVSMGIRRGCQRLELVRVTQTSDEFWMWAKRAQRVALLEPRERSVVLDSAARTKAHLANGSARLSGQEPWNVDASTIRPEDGTPLIP
jgi:hypothetical protein